MNHTSWTDRLRVETERADRAEARVAELQALLDRALVRLPQLSPTPPYNLIDDITSALDSVSPAPETCDDSITDRNDEHRTYACTKPKGHPGNEHEQRAENGEVECEWTSPPAPKHGYSLSEGLPHAQRSSEALVPGGWATIIAEQSARFGLTFEVLEVNGSEVIIKGPNGPAVYYRDQLKVAESKPKMHDYDACRDFHGAEKDRAFDQGHELATENIRSELRRRHDLDLDALLAAKSPCTAEPRTPKCDRCPEPADVEVETNGRVAYACEEHEVEVRSDALRAVQAQRTNEASVESFPTFEQAWKKMEAEGYQYGEDALEHVRFGWEIHEAVCEQRSVHRPETAVVTPEECPKCEGRKGFYCPDPGAWYDCKDCGGTGRKSP